MSMSMSMSMSCPCPCPCPWPCLVSDMIMTMTISTSHEPDRKCLYVARAAAAPPRARRRPAVHLREPAARSVARCPRDHPPPRLAPLPLRALVPRGRARG
eukprot:6978862-Prymnesium_polylepis.1